MSSGKKFAVLNLSAVFLIVTAFTLIFIAGFSKGIDSAKAGETNRDLTNQEVMSMPLVQVAIYEILLAVIMLGIGNPALGLYVLVTKKSIAKTPKI